MKLFYLISLVALMPNFTNAQNPTKPEETEVWTPVPEVVTPGKTFSAPPSDAIILFDGKNLDQWESTRDKSPAKWNIANGTVTVNKPSGDIQTKRHLQIISYILNGKSPKLFKVAVRQEEIVVCF